MRRTLLIAAIAANATMLSGCTTIYSVVEGNFDSPSTALNDYPVHIVAVDGGFQNSHDARIEAGVHTLILQSRKPTIFRVREQKAVGFKAEPCTRYYLAARHQTRLTEQWELVIRRQEPIGGCDLIQAQAAAVNVN